MRLKAPYFIVNDSSAAKQHEGYKQSKAKERGQTRFWNGLWFNARGYGARGAVQLGKEHELIPRCRAGHGSEAMVSVPLRLP
jgi:hypothetical protein